MSGAAGTDPGGPDPRVAALARDMEQTQQQLGELDTLMRQLAADVATLARAITTRREPGGQTGDAGDPATPEVWSWLLAAGAGDPERAADDVTDLVEWIDRVYLAYPGATLSGCWLWHPDVVEELRWLRRTHAEAFHPEQGSWQRVGDWHDRLRPGVARRVAAEVGACELSLHQPGQARGRAPRLAPLGGQAAAVAAGWVQLGAAGQPALTREQLEQAAAYQREQFRDRR
jgi:hypothetical protein